MDKYCKYRYYWRAMKQVYGGYWNYGIELLQECLEKLKIWQTKGVGMFPTMPDGSIVPYEKYIKFWNELKKEKGKFEFLEKK